MKTHYLSTNIVSSSMKLLSASKRFGLCFAVVFIIFISHKGIAQIHSDLITDSSFANTSSGIVSSTKYDAPYDIPKFKNYLGQCKLQAPLSNIEATTSEIKSGHSSNSFYVADENKVAFYQNGKLRRSELRSNDHFYIDDVNKKLHARLKIVTQTCDQVTVLQIHDDPKIDPNGGPNKPLLRVYQRDDRMWAAVKTDAKGSNTTQVDLGSTPSGYFDCDIILVSKTMSIKINGSEKLNKNVSYWKFPSYWKNGVYLQDNGEAMVQFGELTLSDAEIINVRGVALSPNRLDLPIGAYQLLTTTIIPSNASNREIKYFSSNESVAKVSSTGIVTTLREGNTTITVTTNDGSFTDTCSITVNSNQNKAPYDIPKFKDFLENCNFLTPGGSVEATTDEIISGYSSPFFHAAQDKMALYQYQVEDNDYRSELKTTDNWYIDKIDQLLHININIAKQTCSKLTILKIHDDPSVVNNSPNKSLLRIYQRSNNLWAAIKTDSGGINTIQVSLGATPNGYFDLDVALESSNMIIKINGSEKINQDVSYWVFPSHWVNGVSMNDPGETLIYYNELKLFNTTLSVSDINKNDKISIYPNPTTNALFINKQKGSKYELYNQLGGVILNGAINSNDFSFGLENIFSGIYFLKIKNGTHTHIRKIIKK